MPATYDSGVCRIPVKGPILYEPSWIHLWLDMPATTWGNLAEAVARADADPLVREVQFAIYSPGGSIDGMADFLAVLKACRKPTTAVVSDLCASAAYVLAAACGKIVATNEFATFGSVGVVASYQRRSSGVVEITSTEAPDKRPNVETPEGQSVVRAHLDQIHQVMAEHIAAGRGVTVEDVNRNFGRGATMIAREAIARRMVDVVENRSASLGKRRSKTMPLNVDEFRAQHPEAAAALEKAGYDAGHQAGVAKERDRAKAHAVLGKASGLIDRTLDAIASGEEISESLKAEHTAAGIDRAVEKKLAASLAQEQSARVADKAPDTGAAATVPGSSLQDKVCAIWDGGVL